MACQDTRCCGDFEVEPSTAFVVTVTGDDALPTKFEAPCDMTLAFALVHVDDEAGLDACGLGIKPGGGLGELYWSPDEDRSTTYPPLSHIVAHDLKEAYLYPSIFRGLELKKGQKLDFYVQNRAGLVPYDVTFTFYRRKRCG